MSSSAYEYTIPAADNYLAACEAIAALPLESLTTPDLITIVELVGCNRLLVEALQRRKLRLLFGTPQPARDGTRGVVSER